MKSTIIIHSAFLSWLRDVWARACAPERKARKRYPRLTCLVCGKVVAVTTSGLWHHTCQAKEE